jgi:hypothetical protein
MQCRLIELAAGRAAEIVAEFEPNGTDSLDTRLMKIYADSMSVSRAPASIDALIAYARAEAEDLVRAHWPIVCGIARALEQFKVLDGVQVNQIIAAVTGRLEREAEQQRRKAWRTKVTAATAAEFEVFP